MKSYLPSFLINTMIVLYFSYMFSYIYLPNGVRIAFAGIILGMQVVSTFASLMMKMKSYGFILLFLVVIFLINSAVYPIVFEVGGQYEYGVIARFIMPLFFAVQVVCYYKEINIKLISILTLSTLIYGLLWTAVSPSTLVVGVKRLAMFTGEGVSISSGIVACCIVLIHQLTVYNKIRGIWFKILIIPSLVAIFLYKVSSIYLFIVFYFGSSFFLKTKNFAYRFLMIIAGISLILAILIHHELRDGRQAVRFDTFGNGRLHSYVQRMDMLVNRDIASTIFGNGPGSDRQQSEVWRQEKESHSDLLAIITEYGILGLTFISIFIYIAISRMGFKQSIPLFFSMFVSSVITVGMFYRPAVFPFFWMIVGVAMKLENKVIENREANSSRRLSYQTALA